MSEQANTAEPKLNDKSVQQAMQTFASNLGQMLQMATDNARRQARSETYKELGLKWDENSTEIKLPGDPTPMDVDEAIQTLLDFKATESQTFTVTEYLPGMPQDAAHAFVQVLKARYGWVNPQTKQTIFGPEPPRMVMVRTGHRPEDFVEVPVGKFKLQDIKAAQVETGFAFNPKGRSGSFQSFYITAEVKHQDRKIIQELINATRVYLKDHSIYQGKPMRLPVDSSGHVESDVAPIFIDLSKVSEDGLVLTKLNYDLISQTVWTPIRATAQARKHNISLKRGALLWGEFGTGKTLSALVTAKIAEENGWTFIMLDDPKGLVQALEMAKLYQPAVVFAEDIDRVVVRDRDDNANDILNTIDGALAKGAEVMTILTTNHIDKINQGMLRPGRLDALIHVTKPDAEAAVRLVRLYAGDLLDRAEPLTALGQHLSGYIPAIIAEVVNRSKLGMIARNESRIIESDLITAAISMKAHSERLDEDESKPSKEERVGIALRDLLGDAASSYAGDLDEDLSNIDDNASSAAANSRGAFQIAQKELPAIRKLLESHANGNGADTSKAISALDILELKNKVEKIAKTVGAN